MVNSEEKKLPLTRDTSSRIYKIGFTNNRKDARRHLLRSFEAPNDAKAIDFFLEYVSMYCDERYNYKLYTGDWKELYSFEK